MHVIIIGAGIVGVSTAIWLQRDGHDVTLIDRIGPAGGTSYGNAGVLAASSIIPVTVPGLARKAPRMAIDPNKPLFLKWSYLPKLAPWLRKYLAHCNPTDVRRIAKALSFITNDTLEQHQRLAQGTGAEHWIHASDYVFLYDSHDHFQSDELGWSIRRENNYTWQELDREGMQAYDPVFQRTFGYAAAVPNHGHIRDPGQYVADLATHVQHQGGKLLKAEIKDLDIVDGAIRGVRAAGDLISCDHLVLASGVWSGPLADQLGIHVPMESERGYHIELVNPSFMPKAPVMMASAKLAVTPMHGRIRGAGIVEFGGLKALPGKKPLALVKKRMIQALPGIKYDKIEEWMGHRPAPVDSIPLIGAFEDVKGVYAGFGHHHVGLTCGPKTGRLIAEMISGKTSRDALAAYAPARFTQRA